MARNVGASVFARATASLEATAYLE